MPTISIGTESKYTFNSVSVSDPAILNIDSRTTPIVVSGKAGGEAKIALNFINNSSSDITTKNINIIVNRGHELLTAVQDLDNSDPTSCLTFSDGASGLTADQTRELLQLKPVLFTNGAEAGDLNPNNYDQYKDGSTADITTLGNDVMAKYPRWYYKITKDNTTRKTTRQLCNKKLDGFVEYPFIAEDGTLKDAFYMGAYDGYVTNSRLYSSSGKQPTANTTIGNFRTYAKNRGTGYMQLSWYQWMYYQLCYLFVHRSLNSQAAVGMGNVSGSAALQTGTLNTRGASYGDQTGTTAVKCNYVENPWGNIWKWCDKFCTGSAGQPLVTTGAGNDTGAGYSDPLGGANHFNTTSGTGWYYLKETTDSNELGFYPYLLTGGSDSTYYADGSSCSNASRPLAAIGGSWSRGAGAGVFSLYAYYAETNAYSSVSSRLCYV